MANTEILVVKRTGEKVPYDVSKIKNSIRFAVADTGASQLELESKIDQFIKSGIKTSDIQQNIIQHAVQLATPENPEWLAVAGRALAMEMWASYKLRDKSFREIVHYNIKKGEYAKELTQYYSDEDLDKLGYYIKHDRDLLHSHSSLITVRKKYLGKFELNQHMHMVNAMRFGQQEPAETRLAFVKSVYDAFSNREISLATPFMSNIRKGGNVASCFIISIDDSMESIFDNVKRIARISKSGGGVGIYFGNIRAKGSPVSGVVNAAGPITQWVKIFNDTLVAVNQQGKRAGAGTVALPIWHNDILEFLDMQTEHGDVRLKSYDIFPQVVVPDLFYERDREQLPWHTFCPFEVKEKLGIDVKGVYGKEFEALYLQIEQAIEDGKLSVFTKHENARDITKIIMRCQFDTGLPYLANIDTINNVNPNKYDPDTHGITNVNLCTESFSNVKSDTYGHVCNLCSINVANVFDFDRLAKLARLSTRILDHGISLTNNPDPITAAHNNAYRTIGIGIMGLHDHLAYKFKNFSDLEYLRDLAEVIQYNAVLESTVLAKESGPFAKFEHSLWKSGELTARYKQLGKQDWDAAQALIDQYGMRNSQLTSPAPTTSTSIYQDSSASVLPVYSAFFSDDNANGKLLISSKYLKKNPLAYGKTFSKHSATEIIDIVAALQPFIDTGCSMELIFDQNDPTFSAKVVYDAIHYAHKQNIKAIYYIRTIKKRTSEQEEEFRRLEACAGCSG